MGCDIHMYMEKKVNDRWETADFFHYAPNRRGEMELTRIEFMGDRNYKLFARLADVRNGYGVQPIAYPRGVPKDLSDYVRNWYNVEHDWTFGHSYLTLREIFEFKPTEDAPIGGYVTAREKELIELDELDIESDSIFIYDEPQGESKEWIEFAEEDETLQWFVEKLKQRMLEIDWEFEYRPEQFLDNYRLVFWFDN